MKRTSRRLLSACAALLVLGLAWPGSSWAQKGVKKSAPEGASVSGQAVERSKGQEVGKGQAVERGKGQEVGKGQAVHGKGQATEGVSRRAVGRVEVHDGWKDRDRSRVVVTEYYGRRGLPPGLAKRRALPPGLQRQLRERGHLPPGIEKHWVVLPVELERRLPPLPPHYVRRVVGEDLIVVDVQTNFVVSIMAGVFIRW